ncbi:MAG: formyltetrahydrofolate deformylase [Phycisphaerales bacterium]
MSTPTYRLLIACRDTTGIVGEVAGYLASVGANIVDLEQHVDAQRLEFSMRVEFTYDGAVDDEPFADGWADIARRHAMQCRFGSTHLPKRVAILAGPSSHCLADLLYRCSSGDIDANVVGVISNHDRHGPLVAHHEVHFHHAPVVSSDRLEHERTIEAMLDDLRPDLVVLARYMRVLSPAFVDRWDRRMINIHHSFLPAFVGADPYRQAFERGVKVIGATAHFVTQDLDEGPIIAQAVRDVAHHDTVDDLKRKGRDLERIVLAEAVRKWVEDKILVRANRTVVFR